MSMEEGQDGVEAGTNYQRPAVLKGAQDLRYTCFFLSRHYHYLSLVPINLIRPSARHSATTYSV